MSISIASNAAALQSFAAPMPTANPAMKEAVLGLTKALKAGDLDAARQAYAAMVKNAPEGASMTPGSPFAQLGKALVSGDVDAAKAAFGSLVRSKLPSGPIIKPAPVQDMATTNGTVASSTGGSAGTVLNVSA